MEMEQNTLLIPTPDLLKTAAVPSTRPVPVTGQGLLTASVVQNGRREK